MRRVVTLQPGLAPEAQNAFAASARRAGADLLELRTDLHGTNVDAARLAEELPLLAAERGGPLSASWREIATEVERPVGQGHGEASLASWHSNGPLTTIEAMSAWDRVPVGTAIKHVEPLGDPSTAGRLFETQARLAQRFGGDRVTVLATGPLALPFRCALATRNALDYLAKDDTWAAAPGQRLLADAVREGPSTAGVPRRGILGSRLAHSRSPRVHRPPFDRVDLPDEAPLKTMLEALHDHYQGLAVTSPFKIAAARAVGSPQAAVNTLIRRPSGWDAANTDVDGALAMLRRFPGFPGGLLTVLGDGGAAQALRLGAAMLGRSLRVVRRGELVGRLTGDVVWTWPSWLEPPTDLAFREARVAIIAYGPHARAIAALVRRLGGQPVALGACWFVAQARQQQRLWDAAR